MCCLENKAKRELRRLKRKERDLEYAVLNHAMIWYDLRGGKFEAQWADRLAKANQSLREHFWKIRRFKIEHQMELT